MLKILMKLLTGWTLLLVRTEPGLYFVYQRLILSSPSERGAIVIHPVASEREVLLLAGVSI